MANKTEYSANALVISGAFNRQSVISAWSVAQECITSKNAVKPSLKLDLMRLWRPHDTEPAAYLANNDRGTVSVVPVMLSYRSNSDSDIAVIAYAAEDAVMDAPFVTIEGGRYRDSEIELMQGSRLEMIINLSNGSGYIDRLATPFGDTLEFACPEGEKAEISVPPCPRSCLEIVDEDLMVDRKAPKPPADNSDEPDSNEPDSPFHL